jgi:hypothetical protein
MRLSAPLLWLFLLGATSATAQDQTVGPCRPEQVRATTHTSTASGNFYIEVTLTNISDETCNLAGAPRVVAADSGGKPPQIDVRWPVDGTDLEKGRESISLNSKGQAAFVIRTTDKADLPASAALAGVLRVYLPGSPDGRPIARITVESCREIDVSGYRIVN